MWQGLLALKNDTAAVQLHFVSGNNVLAHRSLPAPEGGPPLRIAQRMRLEASQLEGVARRMMVWAAAFLLTSLGLHFCGVLGADSFGGVGISSWESRELKSTSVQLWNNLCLVQQLFGDHQRGFSAGGLQMVGVH